MKKEGIRKILKVINKQQLFLILVLTLIFFGINWTIEYETDTYATFQEKGTWEWMLYENGRLFSALVYYLFETLEVPGAYIYKISYLAAVFFLVLSLSLLARILIGFQEDKKRDDRSCVLLAFFTVANYYIVEYFLFIEKGLFLFAIFLCTLACWFTIDFFRERKKTALAGTYICLLLAVNIYQIIPGYYVVLCLPFILYFSNDIKSFLKNNLVVALAYGLPMLLGLVITRGFLGSSRIDSLTNLPKTLKETGEMFLRITFSDWYHIPGRVFVGIPIIVTIVFAVYIYTLKQKRGVHILGYCYLIVGTGFVAFFPFLMGVTTKYSPRTLYPYGVLGGILLIYLVLISSDGGGRIVRQLVKPSLYFILIAGLIIQYTDIQSVFIERYKTNQADYYYCQILEGRIKAYEEESGMTIDTICFYRDASETWWERGYDHTELNTRAQAVGWGNLNAINLYLGKDYQKGEKLSEYEQYFQKLNWDTWSEEQLIFQDTTLHLCIY
ncbi:MAG: glucosyltransferase domain-containing protein [Lachnospiraceae bacterium]|nr:glucosyltransferase domain-containing protein [Lachnospiraceae bacterium]